MPQTNRRSNLITSQNALRLLSFAALVFDGCSSSSRSSDTQSASQPHGFITASLTEPSMNGMAAQTMTIPAGWTQDTKVHGNGAPN
ncbi:MAG: hypothetical protein WA634_00805 [Silvibacterium sp.]